MWNRRDFLKAIGLGALVAPAAVEVAKVLPADVPPAPALKTWTTQHSIDHLIEREPTAYADKLAPLGPLKTTTFDEAWPPMPSGSNNFAEVDDDGEHPPAPRECWGKHCQSYGKPHLTPWECSIKFRADGTVLRPAERYAKAWDRAGDDSARPDFRDLCEFDIGEPKRLPVPTPEEWAGLGVSATPAPARTAHPRTPRPSRSRRRRTPRP